MGLFNFLKKVFKKEEVDVLDQELIQFSSLHTWIQHKSSELSLQENEVKEELQAVIEEFSKEVEVKLFSLKKINIEGIDAEARLKYIAGNSFKSYISLVEHLMKYIHSLPFETLEDYSQKIENYFVDFFKKSRVPHERSILLVGNELAEVKDALIQFYKKQKSIFDAHLDLRKNLHLISVINEQLDVIRDIDASSQDQTTKMRNLEKNIVKKKKKMDELLEKIASLQTSKAYLDNQKKHQEVKIESSRLNNEYLNAKQLINFKALTNEFHNSAKYMKTVKSYKESFRSTLESKGEKPLLELLEEAKVELQPIIAKLQEIKIAKKNLLKKEKLIQEDEVSKLRVSSKQLEKDILLLGEEKVLEARKYEKIIKNKQQLITSLSEELLKLGVVLEDDTSY